MRELLSVRMLAQEREEVKKMRKYTKPTMKEIRPGGIIVMSL
jgi:hypothetical protein